MIARRDNGPHKMWSLWWVVIIRVILYLVIIGFLLQYIYFGEKGEFFHPDRAILELVAVFFLNLLVITLGGNTRYVNQCMATTFVLDLAVLTRVILASGGFNSVFIPYYLPVLVMASVWLPRSYTAVFPSMATLGVAYVGFAHLSVMLGEMDWLAFIYPRGLLLYTVRYSLPHTVVSTMLILAVLFFVVSYLSGMLSDKLFVEQRLNAEILSSMQEGVAVVDAKHRLIYVNSEFVRIFPEADGATSFDAVTPAVFHPEIDGVTLERLLGNAARSGIVITRERNDLEGRPPLEIHISGISLRGKRNVYGLIFVVSDLTVRKRMEVAERSLERFSAISTMAAGLAHEIRNPLASLRSAIQEIGESFPENSQNRILADVVMAESDRLDGIIGRFLDFSREGKLRTVETRLGTILHNLKTILEHDSRTGDTVINVDVAADPDVVCDPDRLKEVFFNLALNALQAVPAVGGRLDIRLDVGDKGFTPGVEILFSDNGPGIDDQLASRIFEPFFSSKKHGTGMGLALSRKQVALHGGDIEYVNLAEGGTCFRVWLPLQPGTPAKSGTRVDIAGWRRHLSEQ